MGGMERFVRFVRLIQHFIFGKVFILLKEMLYAVLVLKNVEECVPNLFLSFRKAN